MPRLTTIEAEHVVAIAAAADRFGDHQGMTQGRVLQWLAQFHDDHIPLALKILGVTRYYGTHQIRTMSRDLVRIVLDTVGAVLGRVLFVPVGGPGSGSEVLARVLRTLNEYKGIRLKRMADIEEVDPQLFDVVVFLDDFSCTGDQLTTWWTNVEALVRPKGWRTGFAILVLHERARARLEEIASDVFEGDQLTDTDNVLGDTNADLATGEKPVLLEYCRRTECPGDYVTGYGGQGLLVAFKHGCPNNSLPVLWCETKAWKALFNRRAS